MLRLLLIACLLALIPSTALSHPHHRPLVAGVNYTIHYPHKPQTVPYGDWEIVRGAELAAAAGYKCSRVRVVEYRRYKTKHPAGDYRLVLTVCSKRKVLKWLGVIGREHHFLDVTPKPNWRYPRYE